jgi:DNA-binding CsgD family transcriptional regulator
MSLSFSSGNGPHASYILYSPKSDRTEEQVIYSAESWNILLQGDDRTNRPLRSDSNIRSLCRNWKARLDETLKEAINTGTQSSPSGYIDLLKSARRKYTVRGSLLVRGHPDRKGKKSEEGFYLFILERIDSEDALLKPLFRHWKLNNRERQIIQLLLNDKSNKEIASHMELSQNTVKGYMKLLMRRLDVSSRAGILARLLIGTVPSKLELYFLTCFSLYLT